MVHRKIDVCFPYDNDEPFYFHTNSTALELWRLYRERKRLADLGYTSDLRTESTLLIDAFLVIDEEFDLLHEADREKRKQGAHDDANAGP